MPTLDDRLDTHIRSFNSWKNTGSNYCSSYKILELNNYEYDIIEIVYFDTKQELREYERPLIEGQVCVNERIPNRSDAEYYQDHKEYYKEYNSKYYQDNKEKIKDYYQENKEKLLKQSADYRLKNKEKIREQKAEYYQDNKEHIKEQATDYYQNNKDKIKEQHADYYQVNKDKIKEQQADYYQDNKEQILKQVADYQLKNKDKINKKFVCECGGKYTHQHKSTHEKTKIHQDWLKSSNTKTI